MAENQILEEEYDPNYVPTQEEIDEYAEFIGMNLENDEDKELMWIAEEGLKAPLPSEWKPCKTDDDDIYYFNFDSGESRWEHPCDEYYKKLYKSEKAKQRQSENKQSQKEMSKIMAPLKKVKSQIQKSSTKIEDNFDSMFQNEIDQILVSDIVSSNESVSLTPKKGKESQQIAQKLHDGLAALVPKTDNANIPTFHLDLSTDMSQKSDNAENMTKWKKKANEDYKQEKKAYLSKLQKELERFKEETKKHQTAKIEKQINSEMNIFSKKLQEAANKKEIELEQSYENKWKELRASNDYKVSKSADDFQIILKKNKAQIEEIESKHLDNINAMKHEQMTKVKQMKIKHNEDKNQILSAQTNAIEELKKNHEKYLTQIQESMQTDIENLTNKQQSLQQQSDSLQLFREKSVKMQKDFDDNLQQMRIEHENKLIAAKLEWDKIFVDAKSKHEEELKEFINSIEQRKIDCLSEKEVTDYKEKYAMDIESRKEKIKITMHSEYENWKNQKKKYYQHCKKKDVEKNEDESKTLQQELKQKLIQKTNEFEKEMEQIQNVQNAKIKNIELDFSEKVKKINEENKEKMDRILENCNKQMVRMQNEMREREQSKRDKLRNEYKLKYNALMSELEAQKSNIEQNIQSNCELTSANVIDGKYKKLQSENCKLQHQITEAMNQMKEQKISFSKEKRDLHFMINGQKNKLLNLQQQIEEHQEAQNDDANEQDHNIDDDGDSSSLISLYSATLSNSEFVTLQQIETNENNEIPSNASKWSEYLQKEQECIDNMRVQINATKKSLRQKQRKLETMKNGWKKDRDKLKLMSMDTSLTDNKQQFNSFKHMLKKKKHEIDNEVNQINEQILDVRDSSQLLTKRESRLQTLEIEYLRLQNKNNGLVLNESNHSVQSIEYQPKAYNSHKASNADRNIYDLQQRQTKTQHIASNDYEIRQGAMNHSNSSIGQHALKSVISKYVKHNQHTRRTINHHKSWLKSFQNELRNVSDSISHDKIPHRHHRHKKHQNHSKRKLHSMPCSNDPNKGGTGEVVIRVKIEK